MIARDTFGGELYSSVVIRNWRVTGWLHGHLKFVRETVESTQKKLSEVAQLDDATVNYKLDGSVLSQIVAGLR